MDAPWFQVLSDSNQVRLETSAHFHFLQPCRWSNPITELGSQVSITTEGKKTVYAVLWALSDSWKPSLLWWPLQSSRASKNFWHVPLHNPKRRQKGTAGDCFRNLPCRLIYPPSNAPSPCPVFVLLTLGTSKGPKKGRRPKGFVYQPWLHPISTPHISLPHTPSRSLAFHLTEQTFYLFSSRFLGFDPLFEILGYIFF